MVMVLIPFSEAADGAVAEEEGGRVTVARVYGDWGEREKTGSGIEWRKEIERGRGTPSKMNISVVTIEWTCASVLSMSTHAAIDHHSSFPPLPSTAPP